MNMPINMPFGLFVFFSALAVWFVLLIVGFKRRAFGPFVVFGIVFLVFMNVRYLIEGAPAAIAFFIGIYDVLDNLGLRAGEGAAALARCPNNACTVWGDTYQIHPSWGTAFHARFLSGTEFRTNLLYAHLTFNSIVFVLMHVQLWRTGAGSHAAWHKIIGRVSFACLTVGTVCALCLAGSHGSVGEYGGNLSMYGFWSMSLFVYGCAVMGVLAIRKGDRVAHRIWMIRFAGSMWGAFCVQGHAVRFGAAAARLRSRQHPGVHLAFGTFGHPHCRSGSPQAAGQAARALQISRRRTARGATHQQLKRQQRLLRDWLAGQSRQHLCSRNAPQVLGRQGDGGQRRVGLGCKLMVVNAAD